MNFQSCYFWLTIVLLFLSSFVTYTEQAQTDRKCLATCLDYCTNDSQSGIPPDLCSNVCMTTCYSARGDLGSDDSIEKK
ncbi:unnamed protein product [Adineta steineri]|uniref:Uncharacterized protein n=1 Tax=Adineta steineri TaxID=433720 RepID=A0A813UIW1_9BILA|nr:unnamed protein product [Adineta steineri]CAF1007936.1 unnamed protein product [Adineta steineri]CAF1017237.1 unnamed protein product [Adineta steineri]